MEPVKQPVDWISPPPERSEWRAIERVLLERLDVSVRRTTRHGAGRLRSSSFIVHLLHYFWGILVHPIRTIDELAVESSVRWAVGVAALGVLQVWGNMLLFAAFGFNWLGTQPLLPDPTYVGGFGYLQVRSADWLSVFAALVPVLALFGLVVAPGAVQLLSKLWGGRGRYEQMVNVLVFATAPSLIAGWLSEWLTGVPMNLLSGHRYWYVAAMQGEFGETFATIWTTYSIAVYTVPWAWSIVLGVIAVHRIQRIPLWAATVVMVVGFALSLLVTTTFVR